MHKPGANEVELKLRIRPRDTARLRRHASITAASQGQPVTRKLTSIYYDTPQLALLDAGLSLRVRRMAGQWFQAVKAAGHALAGLHQRMEWEDIIAQGTPDFSKIVDPALTAIFDDPALREALRPIFATEVRRTEWALRLPDGSLVELALDQGKVVAGDQRTPVSEIELELKEGNPAALYELALALQADIPLGIENTSKAQLGYAAYRHPAPAIVKAGRISLEPRMTAGQALETVAEDCLAQLQGNLAMVLHGEDSEGVHQMRVALRRLRTAIRVLGNAARAGMAGEALGQEIAWIADLLGQARDLDVFLEETLPPLLYAFPSHPGLLRLRELATEKKRQAYVRVRAGLAAQRYQHLLLALRAWLASPPAKQGQPLPELAEAALRKRHRQLRRHGRRLDEKHPEERHAVRIAAKKLRYAAEFFCAMYHARNTDPYLRQLARLQDILGELNDIAVTRTLLRRLGGHRPSPALRDAMNIFAGWNARREQELLRAIDMAWQQFAQARPFWH